MKKYNIGIVEPGMVAARFADAINTADWVNFWSICGRDIQTVEHFSKNMLHDPLITTS